MRKSALILVCLIIHGFILLVAWPERVPKLGQQKVMTQSSELEEEEINKKVNKTTKPTSHGSLFLEEKVGTPIVLLEGKTFEKTYVSDGPSSEIYLSLIIGLSFAFHAAVVAFKKQ